jgi:hypothetical protein
MDVEQPQVCADVQNGYRFLISRSAIQFTLFETRVC